MRRGDLRVIELIVDGASSGRRLDRYLRRLLPDVPLSRLHAMIRRGEVRSGGARLGAQDRVQAGQPVALRLKAEDEDALRRRLEEGERPMTGRAAALPVLFEDGHILAFDKPCGMAAHPGSGHALAHTVLGALRARVAGGATWKPSLVGRLDRDSSGVQLAGTSSEGLRGLESLSRSHRIRKEYVALVRDRDVPDIGRIDAPLADSGSGRSRMRPPRGAGAARLPKAVEAVTTFQVLTRGGDAALVIVEPLTGRQHQIRAHFASVGAPLAGDVRYGDRRWNDGLRRRAGLTRLYLHCARVRFVHPVSGTDVVISSGLPKGLVASAKALGCSLRRPLLR